MAKKRPTEVSSDAPPHCWNCGQKVKGERAESSRSIGVTYCSWCGLKLKEGVCQNTLCRRFGQKPAVT